MTTVSPVTGNPDNGAKVTNGQPSVGEPPSPSASLPVTPDGESFSQHIQEDPENALQQLRQWVGQLAAKLGRTPQEIVTDEMSVLPQQTEVHTPKSMRDKLLEQFKFEKGAGEFGSFVIPANTNYRELFHEINAAAQQAYGRDALQPPLLHYLSDGDRSPGEDNTPHQLTIHELRGGQLEFRDGSGNADIRVVALGLGLTYLATGENPLGERIVKTNKTPVKFIDGRGLTLASGRWF